MKQHPVKKVAFYYIGFQAFFSLFLWLPIFYEYQIRIGLTDKQFFDLQSLYYLSFCFFEIPTGWVADRWGYKKSLMAAGLLMVITHLLPVAAPHHTGMLCHFLLLATSRSLVSGAANAYLFEYLGSHAATGLYKEIEGKGRAADLVGKVICWPFVGILMAWSLPLPYVITTGFSLLALLFACLLPEMPASHAGHEDPTSSQKITLKPVLKILKSSPLLWCLMIQGVLITVMGRVQITFYQPLLLDKSWAIVSLGTVLSIMTLFEAIGSVAPQWLTKMGLKDLDALFILNTLMASSFMLIAISGKYGAVIGFCLFCLFTGIVFPVQKQLINAAITDSRYRATLLSVESMLARLTSAWVVALMGNLVSEGQFKMPVMVFSVLTMAVVLVLYPLTRHHNAISETTRAPSGRTAEKMV